jgi:hypothetical protein
MTTITIRETAATEQGWQAALSFDNEGDFPLVLRDPFADAQEEALLQWYFEEYLRLPFLDHDKAEAARASITRYREDLFGQPCRMVVTSLLRKRSLDEGFLAATATCQALACSGRAVSIEAA